MRALVYYGPYDMRVTERPEPVPGGGQVKLRVRYVGICGSDVHGYTGATGRRSPPMVMGHEFSAEVAEVGGKATKFKPGDRVTAIPLTGCGGCAYCAEGAINLCGRRVFMGAMGDDGAFAEYLCCGEESVFMLPGSLDDKAGALVEPFAVAYAAVRKALPLGGKKVAVVGAGAIGLFVLAAAKYYGAGKTVAIDTSGARLEAALKIGADYAVCPGAGGGAGIVETLESQGFGGRADVSFEAVGNSPAAQCSIDCARNGGTAVWIGNSDKMVSIDMQQVVTREVAIKGTYVYNKKDFEDSIALLSSGKIDVGGFVSETVGLGGAEAMFRRLAAGDASKIRVLVDMQN